MNQPLRVEIWSDIACPWCYIAKRRFDTALSEFEHRDRVDVIWRSYQLDPDSPRETTTNLNEILAQKHGLTLERAVALNEQMRELGAVEGIEFHFDQARYGNSFDAHRLIHFARTQGLQSEIEDRLFKAYFSDGSSIGNTETLVALAVEVGLDQGRARNALSTDAYARRVRNDTATARRLGLRGVPFFVFDEKCTLAGAQSPDVFQDVLSQAWMESHPLVAKASDSVGYCEGGACALPQSAPADSISPEQSG